MTAEPTGQPSVLETEVAAMRIGPDGLEDYYWPIANRERTGFAYDLMSAYARMIAEHRKQDPANCLPLQFFGTVFLTHVVTLFQGDLLRERTSADKVRVNVPEAWPYWAPLLQEETPAEPLILQQLQNGPQKPNYTRGAFNFRRLMKWLKLLSFKRASVELNGLKIKPINEATLTDNIISTQRTPLIVQHAREVSKDVVFCRSARWFKAVSDEELEQSLTENDLALQQKVLDLVAGQYNSYGIELKPHSVSYLENLVSKGTALLRVHYERLLKAPNAMPKEIWCGTGGNIWDTMLRVAVMASDGTATGHDHGTGAGYIALPMRGPNEYWGCNSFVTFNKNHAEGLIEEASTYPHYEESIPPIEYLNPVGKIRQLRPNFGKPKTVFVMVTLYDNDRGRLGPGNVNNFLVDWQARLITALKGLGYHIVFKIHPENKVPFPKEFEEMGVELVTEPFGQVIDRADLVILDCVFSTTFVECLSTNLPVVILDWYGFPWTETGKRLAEKRCAISRVKIENNRGHPDPVAIEQAIQEAPTKNENHEFYRHFFL